MGNGQRATGPEPAGGVIRSYRDLVAWQRAFQLGLAVCRLSNRLPADERFGLCSQLRRGAVSIASNIATQIDDTARVLSGLITSLEKA